MLRTEAAEHRKMGKSTNLFLSKKRFTSMSMLTTMFSPDSFFSRHHCATPIFHTYINPRFHLHMVALAIAGYELVKGMLCSTSVKAPPTFSNHPQNGIVSFQENHLLCPCHPTHNCPTKRFGSRNSGITVPWSLQQRRG